MKKIIIVIESLHLGGSEKSLISLLNKLDLNQYSFEILLYKKGGEFERFVPDTIKISSISYRPGWIGRIKFKISKILNIKGKYHNAQLFWKAIKTSIPIHTGDYDIAIAWGQGFATYFTSSKILAPKKIAWINTDLVEAGYFIPLDRTIYKEFDLLIGVSRHVKNQLQRIYPDIENKLVRDVIDEDEIVLWSQGDIKVDFNNDVLNVVSVGRLAKPKSFELAIIAINIILKKGVKIHLFIIGEGPERTFLESIIDKYNLKEHITLLGYLENPYPYIKACDIYLQTSKFEGLGRTIIEAGILKKPIVTTNFPTASQILKNRETGLIVDMCPEDVANAVMELSLNSVLRSRFVSNLEAQTNKETQKSLDSIRKLLN